MDKFFGSDNSRKPRHGTYQRGHSVQSSNVAQCCAISSSDSPSFNSVFGIICFAFSWTAAIRVCLCLLCRFILHNILSKLMRFDSRNIRYSCFAVYFFENKVRLRLSLFCRKHFYRFFFLFNGCSRTGSKCSRAGRIYIEKNNVEIFYTKSSRRLRRIDKSQLLIRWKKRRTEKKTPNKWLHWSSDFGAQCAWSTNKL